MERDFMGLTVKQEIQEEPTNPVTRSSAMQWSFSNKAHPQYLSFKGTAQDQYKPKTGFDSLASARLVTVTTTEAVDSIHRPYSGVTVQQNRTNYTVSNCSPHQFGAHSIQQPHEVRVIPVANLHPVRVAPMSSPVSVPTRNGVVGTTDLRGAPKTSTGPAQLTIFYAGSVSVYDNIAPEKAQAIMLLAGNAPPVTPTSNTTSPVQTIPKSPSDAFVISSTTPIISSPIPIASHASQSIGVSNNTNEATIIKSIGVLNSPSNTREPSRVIVSPESRPPSYNLSAVPQARRASLARFLEKRKERVVNASPYANSNQTPQYTTPGSGNWNFSVNSSGSCPLPATN